MKVMPLRDNRQFQKIYRKGQNFVSPSLVTYVLCSAAGAPTRIGITASKKVGNAVRRNRARRVIRESIFHLRPFIPKGYQLVFVSRVKTTFVPQPVVEREMVKHLKKAGVFLPDFSLGMQDS